MSSNYSMWGMVARWRMLIESKMKKRQSQLRVEWIQMSSYLEYNTVLKKMMIEVMKMKLSHPLRVEQTPMMYCWECSMPEKMTML